MARVTSGPFCCGLVALFVLSAARATQHHDKCTHVCPPTDEWDLDDGPCIDLRSSHNTTTAYESMLTSLADYYAFTDWRGINWTEVSEAGLPDAKLADTTGHHTRYATLAVTKAMASISDGHMEHDFVPECGGDSEEEFYKVQYDAIGGGYGFTIARLDSGDVIVTHVVPGSKAAQAGLKPGQVVTNFNSIPVASAVRESGVSGWMWASKNPATATARELESYRSAVRAKVGTQSNWTIEDVGTVSLIAEDDDYATWNLTAPTRLSVPDPAKHPVSYSVLPSGYGYLGVDDEEMDNPEKYKAHYSEALNALAHTPGLIVDIRGNNGGDDQHGATFTGYFVARSSQEHFYEDQAYSNRLLKDVGKSSKMNGTALSDYAIVGKSVYQKPQQPSYTKPVVLLVNSLCKSTGEGIAMGFKRLPRSQAQIVGFHGTSGSFGMSGGRVLLPYNVGLQFPFGRSLDANHQIQIDSDATLDGGVHPTVRIPHNASNAIAFVQSRVTSKGDVELDFAENVLRNMITI